MSEFSRVLIANRGEIAVRIIRTARNLGYHTIAVYSDADESALHVQEADEAVYIGPSTVAESYLNVNRVLEAASLVRADAIHPGYGFLSENTEFASACAQQGICFIGPPASAIELMGSKRRSKQAVSDAGVVTVPGYDGADQSEATLANEARRIGVPLMIKSSAGGGGRGMRLVQSLENLESELRSARQEAESAFGSGELILEKAVLNPRHIEIQIFADEFGNCIHLGDRDCSVQRRHQKVIEEAPAPFLSPELRQAMGQAAVTVAKLCDYVGAGTVEFLVADDGSFYFLEMNTRLQVEHPVTEMITGQDLVEWQFRIAAGESLPLRQEQVTIQGHAVEARLYAEDPYQNYLPQTGQIHLWQTEQLPGVRIDAGIATGTNVSAYYDPMLAKVIAHGTDRSTALRKLGRALNHCVLLGPTTNRFFLKQLITHPVFQSGQATTAFIPTYQSDWLPSSLDQTQTAALIAATLIHERHRSSTLPTSSRIQLEGPAGTFICHVRGRQVLQVSTGTLALTLTLKLDPPRAQIHLIWPNQNTVRRQIHFHLTDAMVYLDDGAQSYCFSDITHRASANAHEVGSGKLLSPMSGCLMNIHVEPGDQVTKGDVVAIVEAMKMEHQIKADRAGFVQKIDAKPGQQLNARQQIMVIGDTSL